MLTRRYFLRASAIAVAGVGAGAAVVVRAARQGERHEAQDPGRHFSARRGRWPEHRRAVLREALLRPASDASPCPRPGKPNGGHRSRWTLCVASRVAATEALVGQRAAGDRPCRGLARSDRGRTSTRRISWSRERRDKTSEDGWLNRALPCRSTPASSPIRAIAHGGANAAHAARQPRRASPSTTWSSFRSRNQASGRHPREHVCDDRRCAARWRRAKKPSTRSSMIESINRAPVHSGQRRAVPAANSASGLQQVARLIKADVGVEVAFADIGGWDHHSNESGAAAETAAAVRRVARRVRARHGRSDGRHRARDDVGVRPDRAENGNGGTDHGHGNVMMVLGGAVHGGHGLRPVARPGAGTAVRTARPRGDDRLPRRARRGRHKPSRAADRSVFPGFTPGPALGLIRS